MFLFITDLNKLSHVIIRFRGLHCYFYMFRPIRKKGVPKASSKSFSLFIVLSFKSKKEEIHEQELFIQQIVYNNEKNRKKKWTVVDECSNENNKPILGVRAATEAGVITTVAVLLLHRQTLR